MSESPPEQTPEDLRLAKTKRIAKKKALALVALELESKVVEMKLEGMTNKQVAESLNKNTNFVTKVMRRAFERISTELEANARHMRGLEVARLDRLQKAIWLKAIDGQLGAMDRVLRIMERRAALLGLDAPQLVEVNATLEVKRAADYTDDELADVISRAKDGRALDAPQPLLTAPTDDVVIDARGNPMESTAEEIDAVLGGYSDKDLERIAACADEDEDGPTGDVGRSDPGNARAGDRPGQGQDRGGGDGKRDGASEGPTARGSG